MARSLPDAAALRGNHYVRDRQRYLPLYEGTMIGIHDHRAADVVISPTAKLRPHQPKYIPTTDKTNPSRLAIPIYWVSEEEVSAKSHTSWRWLLGFSNATSVTNQRTMKCSAEPRTAVSDAQLLGPYSATTAPPSRTARSFGYDYVARQKIGGINFKFMYLKQLPVLPPSTLEASASWITPHMLELSYTAWDMAGFGSDLGYDGTPFRWDEERRALIRAEIDALMFRL